MEKHSILFFIKDLKKRVGMINSIPIFIGGVGFACGLYKFISYFLYAPINHLSGTVYTFYSTSFLIQLLCIPASVILSSIILLGTWYVYHRLALEEKKSLICISYSFLLFAVPLLTSIASDKISSLYLGLISCLCLYIWINILTILFLWLEKRYAGVRLGDCLEISVIIMFVAWFILRWHIHQLDNMMPFRYIVIVFPAIVILSVFLVAIAMSYYFKKTFIYALNIVCVLFLIYSLYYVLSYFLSMKFNFYAFSGYILVTTPIVLYLRKAWPIKPKRLTNYINKSAYLIVIPLIIFCFMRPLMFSSDLDGMGNWENVEHITAKNRFFPAKIYLEGGKMFKDFVPPHGIGEVFFHAALLKFHGYDYSAIIHTKLVFYAIGLIIFYYTICCCVRRRLIVLCFLLGLASYLPFYYGYNNWDMHFRYMFFWLSFIFSALYTRYGKKYMLFFAGSFIAFNLVQGWDIGVMGLVNGIYLLCLINLSKKSFTDKWKLNGILAGGFFLIAVPFVFYLFSIGVLKKYVSLYLYYSAWDASRMRVTNVPSLLFWVTVTQTSYLFTYMNTKIIISYLLVIVLLFRYLFFRVDYFTKIIFLLLLNDGAFMFLRYTVVGDGGTLVFKAALYGSLSIYMIINHFFKSRHYMQTICLVLLLGFSPNLIYHSTAGKSLIQDFPAYRKAEESVVEKLHYLVYYDQSQETQRFHALKERFKRMVEGYQSSFSSGGTPPIPLFSDKTPISFHGSFIVRRFKHNYIRINDYLFSEDYGYGQSNAALNKFISSNSYDTTVTLGSKGIDEKIIVLDLGGDLNRYTDNMKRTGYSFDKELEASVRKQSILDDHSGILLNVDNPLIFTLMRVGYPYLSKGSGKISLIRAFVDGRKVSVYPTVDRKFAIVIPQGIHEVKIIDLAKSNYFIYLFIFLSLGTLFAFVVALQLLSRFVRIKRHRAKQENASYKLEK